MRLDKKLKKKLLLNAPYVLFIYLFDKVAQGIRLAPGSDASQKLLHLADGFGSAFASPLPSIHPIDLLIGVAGAVIMWVVVYVRGKNAKRNMGGVLDARRVGGQWYNFIKKKPPEPAS